MSVFDRSRYPSGVAHLDDDVTTPDRSRRPVAGRAGRGARGDAGSGGLTLIWNVLLSVVFVPIFLPVYGGNRMMSALIGPEFSILHIIFFVFGPVGASAALIQQGIVKTDDPFVMACVSAYLAMCINGYLSLLISMICPQCLPQPAA